jgi:hypothetical protein
MHQIKLIIIVSIVILLNLILPITSVSNDNPITFDQEIMIDQFQENASYEQPIHSNIKAAQSFIPSKSPLTQIEIKISKPRKTDFPLILSIKRNLTDSSLISSFIPAEQIPFFSHWIRFNITDIDVVEGETYYLIVSSNTPSENPYRWYYDYHTTFDPYSKGKLYRSSDSGMSWEKIETDNDFIDAAFRTYTYNGHVDLVCTGFLNWTANVSRNKTDPIQLSGSFTVENNGTPFSKLDWEIISWPSWGTWEFSQMNQTGLQPENGPTTVTVDVEGPSTNFPDTYEGKVIIRNKNNKNDSCTIRARLVTAKEKEEHQQESFFPYFFKSFLNKISDVTESSWMKPKDIGYLSYFFIVYKV